MTGCYSPFPLAVTPPTCLYLKRRNLPVQPRNLGCLQFLAQVLLIIPTPEALPPLLPPLQAVAVDPRRRLGQEWVENGLSNGPGASLLVQAKIMLMLHNRQRIGPTLLPKTATKTRFTVYANGRLLVTWWLVITLAANLNGFTIAVSDSRSPLLALGIVRTALNGRSARNSDHVSGDSGLPETKAVPAVPTPSCFCN